MAVYTVDPLAIRRATLLTSHDRDDVVTDAIFTHGTPMIDDASDERLLRFGGRDVKVRDEWTGGDQWYDGC